MIFPPQYSLLSLFLCLPLSVLHAYARVIDRDGTERSQDRATLSRSQAEHDRIVSQGAKVSSRKAHHMVSGSMALRRLDVDDYTYGSFNLQAIHNIDEKTIHDISWDYAFAYHYRPDPTYSLGLSFDRLQVNQNSLDLRYSSTDSVPPDPQTLDLIASDLIADDDLYAIAHYYQPKTFGNRGYAYEGVARAYILPQWISDPFLQATIGYTHNRGSVHRLDGSAYILSSDQLWTWSIGGGWSYPLASDLKIEMLAMIRNQHKVQFGDRIAAPSQSAEYSFTAHADRYYSADWKLSLCRTW